MSSAKGTTPTLTVHLSDQNIDLLAAEHVYVTLKNGAHAVTKKDQELTIQSHQITFTLNQEETLWLGEGSSGLQVNWTYQNGTRASSSVANVIFTEQLLERVVP